MWRWLARARQYATGRDGPTGLSPLAVGLIAMAGAWAGAWGGGLAVSQALALGLAALLGGVVVVSIRARRRRAARAEQAARRRRAAGDFDLDEVIMQDATSGRTWRLGDVYFLSAAEKRRLEAERPNVWKAYRARFLRDMVVPPVVPD